jgi:hypothetical protein
LLEQHGKKAQTAQRLVAAVASYKDTTVSKMPGWLWKSSL